MKRFTGINGTIIFDDRKVTIIREKKLDRVFHQQGSIDIPLSQIDLVMFSEAGLTNGYIAILEKNNKIPHSVFTAIKHQNAVIFRFPKNQQAQEFARQIKVAVFERKKSEK